jgi:hypothetical protein
MTGILSEIERPVHRRLPSVHPGCARKVCLGANYIWLRAPGQERELS